MKKKSKLTDRVGVEVEGLGDAWQELRRGGGGEPQGGRQGGLLLHLQQCKQRIYGNM